MGIYSGNLGGWLLLLLLFSSTATHALPPPLPDQNGSQIDISELRGAPLLVIVVSARKLRHIKGWEEGLRDTHPDLVSARVADVNEEPRPDYEQVSAKLRKRVPEGVSIMIDLQRLWAQEYQLDTAEPCLLLFTADYELIAQFRGRANKERLAEVSGLLDEMQVLP